MDIVNTKTSMSRSDSKKLAVFSQQSVEPLRGIFEIA
jgi:hypothetical protein